jgi:glycerol-1-phosphate dehydrogenase [NAD(P)+]
VTRGQEITVDTLDDIRAVASAAPDARELLPIGLREVTRGPAAIHTVADSLGRLGVPEGGVVAVLCDATPKSPGAGGGDVVDVVREALAQSGRYRPVPIVVRPHGSAGLVHADEHTVAETVRRVAEVGPGSLVTVGSGTMADLGKVAAQHLDLVHVVVQTAASVNGFADDQSVLLRNGAKRTTPSRWPDALVIDSDVLAAAPRAMTCAGLGDQLSMFTASADWYLAAASGFDTSYSATVVQVLRRGGRDVLDAVDGLRDGSPRALSALADGLTRGGLAMGLAGRTSPSSGTEHTISHLLEMHAGAHGVPAASHGSQVGVASVVAAAIWQRLRARFTGRDVVLVRRLDEDEMRERVFTAFAPLDADGTTARECWHAYRRKLEWINRNRDRLQRLCTNWAGHDGAVGDLLASPETITGVLRDAGAPWRFSGLDPCPEFGTVHWAVRNCHLMRDRFTVVDLAEVTGLWTAEEVADVLARTQWLVG